MQNNEGNENVGRLTFNNKTDKKFRDIFGGHQFYRILIFFRLLFFFSFFMLSHRTRHSTRYDTVSFDRIGMQ